MRHVLLIASVLAGCSPRLSMGYDTTARTQGPLASLQAVPRLAAFTDAPVPAPPEGRNYSAGLGFGDQNFNLGVGVRANGVSGSTLEIDGPRYLSAAASLDFRYQWLRIKNFSAGVRLAPTRTLLLDSTSGARSWGSGIAYGGGVTLALKMFNVYADAYQEQIVFGDGPAMGTSSRTGVTVGVAFQP